MRISMPAYNRPEIWALVLRVGLGCVFIIGGWFKLSKLLSAEHQAAIVAKYMSPHGYINQFFADYLFTGQFGDWLTPWFFLSALSTFELLAGLALVAGFLVRPLSLIFAFMMWSFVFALPVATAPGMTITVDTFTTPAMLVQSRDIALSGMMFVLFNLGPGAYSADEKLFGPYPDAQTTNWDNLGLLLRLSIAVPFLVGGAFAGLPAIKTFGTAGWILLPIGILLASGLAVRPVGIAVAAIMVYYIGSKISLEASLVINLNAFKREVAFLAAGAVLAIAGGGHKFTLTSLKPKSWGRSGDKVAPAG